MLGVTKPLLSEDEYPLSAPAHIEQRDESFTAEPLKSGLRL